MIYDDDDDRGGGAGRIHLTMIRRGGVNYVFDLCVLASRIKN